MSAVRWSDVRDKHVGAIGEQDVEQGKTRLLAQVRAHRLAEMRKRRGLTQRQVAQAMGVTVGRVSQIERFHRLFNGSRACCCEEPSMRFLSLLIQGRRSYD